MEKVGLWAKTNIQAIKCFLDEENTGDNIWFKMSSLKLALLFAIHIENVKTKGKAATIILWLVISIA